MITQPGVLNINNDPVFLVFGEQVKPAVDRADDRGKGFFGFNPVDLQVQAEEVLDEGFEDVGPGKGFFENDSVTQRGDFDHGDLQFRQRGFMRPSVVDAGVFRHRPPELLDIDRNNERRAAVLVEPADAFLNQGEVQSGGAGLGRGFDREVVAKGFAGGEVARQGCAFAVEFEPGIVRGLPVATEMDRTLAGAAPGLAAGVGEFSFNADDVMEREVLRSDGTQCN